MRIIQLTINIDKNIITLHELSGECFEFNMNECKTLPHWAEEQLGRLHFVRQIGECMIFE